MRVEPTPGDGNLLARTLGVRPSVLRGVNRLLLAFVEDSTLEPRLRELCRQAVAPIGGCRYCQTLGHDDALVTPREAVAIEYAVQLAVDPTCVADELWERLREHLTEAEAVDLTAFVSYIVIGGQTFGAAMGLPEATAQDAREFQRAVADGLR